MSPMSPTPGAPGPPGPPGRAAEAGDAAEHAARVVLLALLRVLERVVGGLHLLEALLGRRVVRVAIGVVLAGELAVGTLELLVGGLLVDAEDVVEIARHRRRSCLSR